MPYETITVKPMTPIIGAEISGVDLRKPLGNQQFQEVHDALMAHQVIFFRDQELTLEQHKAFGRLFGELHIHPNSPGPDGHPEILPIHADANSNAHRRRALRARMQPAIRKRPPMTRSPTSEQSGGRWRYDDRRACMQRRRPVRTVRRRF